MTSFIYSLCSERVLKSEPISCILVFTNCFLVWGVAIYTKFSDFLSHHHQTVSMSNSRWYTDGSSVTSSSPAVSDTSDADVTLRSTHHTIRDEHGLNELTMPPVPPPSSFSRPNRPPCLHKTKELKADNTLPNLCLIRRVLLLRGR
ncbi:hypothetical protein Y032_0075g912 [Ancylostoma ceylanicum]|uniref:Uncharacterized protein n=1 Tax=Ancylostoma ceylanicum TaxID=53326 RepID=A0A016TV00_9BILA|nr:hypothetical protein Y032_0075g912 [Ancylostoma ceylanicum]